MSKEMNWMRRKFLQVSSLFGAGFLLSDAASAQHEHHQKAPAKAKQAAAGNAPVITPDLPKLEYKLEDGVKVFNLTAEVVECELMPKTHMGSARKMNAW